MNDDDLRALIALFLHVLLAPTSVMLLLIPLVAPTELPVRVLLYLTTTAMWILLASIHPEALGGLRLLRRERRNRR